MRAILTFFLITSLLACSLGAEARRIKDLATIQGVRHNQLIGYGLVVGLDGTGDMTILTPFTVQSFLNMLTRMGINTPPASVLQTMLKNVAAVMVTADLPPFSRPGQTIDVTVSSVGNANSLLGGTLLMTPLKGADGQVYAMAQGNLLVGGVGGGAKGSKVLVNHQSVGLIPSGATVERLVNSPFSQGDYITLELNEMDFTTATQMADVINQQLALGQPIAAALDGRTLQVRAPGGTARVQFMSRLENLQVDAGIEEAKVIINARNGSVVMNQNVTLEECAVAHGNLTVVISALNQVSQPNPLSNGSTVQTGQAAVNIKEDKGALILLNKGVSLNQVIRALNTLGAKPEDLLSILQSMKAAGALHADLEII
ncbi:MAG: flagellar basal body P-ring protein FlgI [Ferrovum myxofaciens]|uniref:flagellar basal body P-ring protein FlgI n=1 Tax=Ferrovum myxofaciens TaxID=416213 RepID=UPI002355B8F9|nr:flagellar basal body P-ring protein FlgI [Ferrovum myxofaciens]QKE41085.1 MAG: flagellar basal body P-ring protein FlgI [Ferrovum myxofaciens]